MLKTIAALCDYIGLQFFIQLLKKQFPSISKLKKSKSLCKKISPVRGLEWARGFQEVKVPRFHYNGTGLW
jgi:hypothetical protein